MPEAAARPPTTLDRVTLISVTYNSRSRIDMMAGTMRAFRNVVVMDNASRDGTAAALRAAVPHAHCIEGAKNIGFGAGINAALTETRTEFALVINPDCAIDARSTEILVETADEFPSMVLMSPQIVTPAGQPEISFDWAHPLGTPSCPYLPPDGPASTMLLSGCCLFLRVPHFRAMGCFDERFFMYFEEKDICRRAVARGLDVILVPGAQATHVGGASSTPSWRVEHIKLRHYARSKRLFMAKHEGRPTSPARQVLEFLASLIMIAVFAVTLQGRRARKWVAKAHSFI
jgi:N-acetylglucosaminyl-diphospho-decaprenol L-rhamnosyltransferase